MVATTRAPAMTFTFACPIGRSPGAGPPTRRRVPLIPPTITGDELAVSAGWLVECAAEPKHPALATSAETQKTIGVLRRTVF
jgi:hypothetical protein